MESGCEDIAEELDGLSFSSDEDLSSHTSDSEESDHEESVTVEIRHKEKCKVEKKLRAEEEDQRKTSDEEDQQKTSEEESRVEKRRRRKRIMKKVLVGAAVGAGAAAVAGAAVFTGGLAVPAAIMAKGAVLVGSKVIADKVRNKKKGELRIKKQLQKGKTKHKSDCSPVKEHEDEWDASSVASSTANVCSASQCEETCANSSQNLDVIQKLDMMRIDFAKKIDSVLNAIHDIKKDVRDGRMEVAEKRTGNAEEAINSEKSEMEEVVKRVAFLSHKLDDLENCSRRSNLRLVNLPEKVENPDAVAFLEKWLSETLGPETFPTPPIITRAHRLPARTQSHPASPPRVLIMKFLNFQDKVRVMRAARAKGQIMYGEQEVRIFPDLSAELHRQRRRFDGVKQRLRSLNINYGIVYPAKLRLTIDGQTREFEHPADVEKFLQGI